MLIHNNFFLKKIQMFGACTSDFISTSNFFLAGHGPDTVLQSLVKPINENINRFILLYFKPKKKTLSKIFKINQTVRTILKGFYSN